VFKLCRDKRMGNISGFWGNMLNWCRWMPKVIVQKKIYVIILRKF